MGVDFCQDIKSGTLHPNFSANKKSILAGLIGGREADRLSPPKEPFIALFSSAMIYLDTMASPGRGCSLLTQRSHSELHNNMIFAQ